MMITREVIKSEIDKVQDGYLEILYRIIQALMQPLETVMVTSHSTMNAQNDAQSVAWHHFIEQTFGCLADDPIERGEQGEYEIREAIE